MFAKGLETETSIELWHKRIGHINLQRLRAIQSKEVVIGLPPFESTEYAKHANSENNTDTRSQKRGT